MLRKLRRRIALVIYPEMDPWSGDDFDRAFRVASAALNPGDPVAGSAVSGPQGPEFAPRAWAELRTPEEARVWIAGASEEGLREMAAHLLAGHPVSREEAAPQQAILLAALSSEAISRRVSAAMDQGAGRRSRWRPEGSVQGLQR